VELEELLKDVATGKIQLPDFQRDYVWSDEDVRSLLASVAKGFPVGALLMLGMGGKVNFKPRLLEGVISLPSEPEALLLDGQQRIISLFQSTYSEKPVQTLNQRKMLISRYYYLDINRAIDGSTPLEEAIIGVPKDKVIRENFGRDVKMDLSTREAEFAHDMFPLNLSFDHEDWRDDWRDYWRNQERDVSDLDKMVMRHIIKPIPKYQIPIIKLDKDNSREAVCLVFEKVNVGGKKLDAFELVTAIYAASNFDLRRDWNGEAGENRSEAIAVRLSSQV